MLGSETAKIRQNVKKYCFGRGIDIGCRHDKITPTVLGVDVEDVYDVDKVIDASKPIQISDKEFDFVYSSHCLEHIQNTKETLTEWIRILKVGGYIMLYLPHKDLYKGNNPDHKHEFVQEDITKILLDLNIGILENYIHQYSFLIVGVKKNAV